MNELELEKAHRRELNHMMNYWKDRALAAEKNIRIMTEMPGLEAFFTNRIKCESEVKEIKCSNCTCWKSKEETEANDP